MLEHSEAIRLLSPQELLTLGGAVTAVFFITQGLRYAFGWNAKYVGLFFSLFISLGETAVSPNQNFLVWLAAITNGFIIYSSAIGLSSITGSKKMDGPTPIGDTEELLPDKFRNNFWKPWF